MLPREETLRRIENIKIALTAVQNRLMLLRDEMHYKEAEYKKLKEELARYEKMLES